MTLSSVRATAGCVRRTAAFLGIIVSCVFALAIPALAQTPYNSITLDWTATGDDGTAGRASYYDLRYRTTNISGTDTLTWWNGATQVSGEPTPGVSGSTDSYTVTGLTQGTTYYFVIRALDEAYNISGYSNLAVGATQSCNAPTAMPGSFSAAADTGQVQLTWSDTTDPLALSINIYRGVGSSGALTLYRNLVGTPTSFLDTGLSAGTTYRYQAAWMGSACEGPRTAIVSRTTPGNPPPPPPPPTSEAQPTVKAYPNPSSGSVQFVLDVPHATAQSVDLRLYDMSGHLIAILASGTYSPGSHQINWSRASQTGQRVAPGYYEVLGTVAKTRVRERLILLP